PVTQLGAPMDVLWFRIDKRDATRGRLRGAIDTGRMAVLIDRQSYWQCAYLIPKGAAEEVKARGVAWLRAQMQALFPDLDLSRGENPDPLLHKVQARRTFPTRVIQAGQKAAQDNIIGAVLSGSPITRAPWIVRMLNRFPLLQRIPGRIIGLGVRRERVQSPL